MRFLYLFNIIIALIICANHSFAANKKLKTIYVSPKGGVVEHKGQKIETISLNGSFKDVKAGDEIVFTKGIYLDRFFLKKKRGTKQNPIIIKGDGHNVIFDGDRSQPKSSGLPCFEIAESEWIEIENLQFRQCWPMSIRITSSQNIVFRSLIITDSKWAIYAHSPNTQHIIVEDSAWNQDPSGKLWTDLPWASLHHGKHSYYNGAFFFSTGITGNVIIRNNTIRNAYNGIRMKGNQKRVRHLNKNVQIYNNKFIRIRDNPIEPEISAYNWWIHHNEINNAHAWFSLTELHGGYIYIFRNVGWNDEPYGIKGDHSRGKVLKFEKDGPLPTMPIYVFHNTWYAQGDYISPVTVSRNVYHYNNILFLKRGDSSTLTERNFHPSYRFENDLVNRPVSSFANNKWKKLVIGDPGFTDAANGKFGLLNSSPAIDSGKVLTIDGWQSRFDGNAPDIGAFEGEESLEDRDILVDDRF